MSNRQTTPEKLFLVLVEGSTEITALRYALSSFIDRIDPNITVEFVQKIEDGKKGGDITSERGSDPEAVMGIINKLMIKPFLRDYGLYEKHICQVIHIVDIDGCYVPDTCIVQGETDKAIYGESTITYSKPDAIRKRNADKSKVLDFLAAQKSIKSNHSLINYRTYYFSCNLDHFIAEERNMTLEEKVTAAADFESRCITDPPFFQSYFLSEANPVRNMTYEESWNYLRQGSNSLSGASNLCLLIKDLLDGALVSYPEPEEDPLKEKQNSKVALYARYVTKSGNIKSEAPSFIKRDIKEWLALDPKNKEQLMRRVRAK